MKGSAFSIINRLQELKCKEQFLPCPLLSSVPNMARKAKIFILILEKIIKIIFYERRDYESVDENSLS